MLGLLTAVHLLIAVVLILIVLVQSAKGTDVGSSFGGMGGQAAFGPRGTATFLSKATIGLAAAFMVTSVALSIMGREVTGGGESILSGEETAPAQTAPGATTPGTPGAQPAGAPAVAVDTQGIEGMKAVVTVENPDEAPAGSPPAATVQTGPAAAPTTPPAAPTGTPTGQASPGTPNAPAKPPAAPPGP